MSTVVANRIDLLDRALAERSLADFVRQAWPLLEPRTPFHNTWLFDLLMEYLEGLGGGEKPSLWFTPPLRSGKVLSMPVFRPCGGGLGAPASGSCSPATARC